MLILEDLYAFIYVFRLAAKVMIGLLTEGTMKETETAGYALH